MNLFLYMMVKSHIITTFMETAFVFNIAKLLNCKLGSSSVLVNNEDPHYEYMWCFLKSSYYNILHHAKLQTTYSVKSQ